MKHTIFFLFFLLIPHAVWSQEITGYFVDIEVQDDASMDIQEEISYRFGEQAPENMRHSISLRYALDSGKRAAMEISDIELHFNGQAVVLESLVDEKQAALSFNVPQNISSPVQVSLRYTVHGAIHYHENYNKLNWNSITTQERYDIKQFAGSIRIPKEFEMLSPLCVVSTRSENTSCNIAPRNEGFDTSYFAHKMLSPEEEISMEARFTTGVTLNTVKYSWTRIEIILLFVGVLTAGILFMGILFFVHQKILSRK